MTIRIYPKEQQAYGAFNEGEIVENKPLGFPQDGGELRPYSNIFYWANAVAKNDSTIGLHPHQGFEILSFILEGRIRHYDTKMDEWKWLSAGDVQLIQAGNGISHAEHMEANSRMFQIWLDPNLSKTLQQEAKYTDYPANGFEAKDHGEYEQIIYSGQEGKIGLDTEAVEFGRVKTKSDGFEFPLNADSILSVYVLNGSLKIDGKDLKEHDFAMIEDAEKLSAAGEAEWFYIKSPKRPSYATYTEMILERKRK